MSDELLSQIYHELNLKETDELLKIWQANDRVEWSKLTFEAIKRILSERGVVLPTQGEPIYEYSQTKDTEDTLDEFSEAELKIIDDENPPDFYDPIEVLKFSKWIERAAIASIVLTVFYNLTRFSYFRALVMGYFFNAPNNFIVYSLAIVVMILNMAVGILVTYFLLTSLAKALKILMEMEFNSRKAK